MVSVDRLEEKRKTMKEKLLTAGKPTPLSQDPEVQALAKQVASAKERVAKRRVASTLALLSAPHAPSPTGGASASTGTATRTTGAAASGTGTTTETGTGGRAKGRGGAALEGRAADERRKQLRREAADRTDDRWRRRAEALERIAKLQVAGIVKEPRIPPPILTSFPSD